MFAAYGYTIECFNNEENINNIIKTVVREYKWSPETIGDLFFDRRDYFGLYYWYDDALEMNEEMRKQIEASKKKK